MGPDSTPVSIAAIRMPLATLTRTATLLVPAVVMTGFVAVGRPWVGVAPTLIVLLTLWLLHTKLVALACTAESAGRTLHDSTSRHLDLRAEIERLRQRLATHDQELLRAQEVTAFALAKLVESRDPSTGVHLERVRAYSKLLVAQLGHRPQHRDTLTETYATAIYQASPLHDVGKVGIPDRILLKPGKLTPEEFAVMKRHASLGGRTLRAAARRANDNLFLNVGHEIALYHHEHWDGNGYPFGLPGTRIPLAARIVALADVYDALTSERCYKHAWSHDEARAYIVGRACTQFDPDIVEAFIDRERDFLRIQAAFTGVQSLDGDDLPELVRELIVLGAA